MKICIQLQRQFAYIGHAMAVNLQERYGVKEFCAYVELMTSLRFLTQQKEVAYSGFLVEADLHNSYKGEPLNRDAVCALEREYGIPNLWPYIEIDRTVRHGLGIREYPRNTPLLSHDEMMRTLTGSAKRISAFLDAEKPDVILFSVITDASCLLLYHIAKKKGIKTLFIQTERVGVRYTLSLHYSGLSYVDAVFRLLEKKELSLPEETERAREFLMQFRKKPMPHSVIETPTERPVGRAKQFRFLLPRHVGNSIYWFIKNSIDYFRYKDRDYIKNPFYLLIDRIRRKMRVLRGFEDLYDEFNPNDEFVFYPLQVEPEMSTSLFAPFYTDQLWLAKQIARSLPIHMKLYVKEHPAMWGFRPRKYYRELKNIPNLKLVRPTIFSFTVMQSARMIAAITSTVGWEALLLKKPVVTFGNTFYNALPMVKKCSAIAELPYLIKAQLEHYRYDEQSLIHLLTALFKEGAPLDLVQLWLKEGASNMEKKKKEVAPFVDYLAEKLHLKPSSA